jgi:hypothetical protein
VCGAAARAAGARLHAAAQVKLQSSDPGYLECRVSARGIALDVVAQAIPEARSYFDTEIVHLVQTYAEPGGTRDRTQLPKDLHGLGSEAAWVPGQRRLLATNATLYRGGSVVEITATGGNAHTLMPVARDVAAATLATAPRGPNPGPPPA